MAATGTGTAEQISMSGQVRGYDLKPIIRIKVTAYRDKQELAHAFTDAEGRYAIEVQAGKLMTIRFDTHPTLTNVNEWHPSVVANIEAKKDMSLDRFLMRAGFVDSETAAVDALTGYQFAAMWANEPPDRAYAASASSRLGQIKFKSSILMEICDKLRDYFSQLARTP